MMKIEKECRDTLDELARTVENSPKIKTVEATIGTLVVGALMEIAVQIAGLRDDLRKEKEND